MVQKSSFLLAALLVVNPFVILFFQNCSALPKSSATPTTEQLNQNSNAKIKEMVRYNLKN